MRKKTKLKNQPDFSRQVKATLMLRGISLREWSASNGYPVSTVSMTMHGKRTRGHISKPLIKKLQKLVEAK
jgi:lambda repressor-like predicted transcriptional regulator